MACRCRITTHNYEEKSDHSRLISFVFKAIDALAEFMYTSSFLSLSLPDNRHLNGKNASHNSCVPCRHIQTALIYRKAMNR
jgi:hypothetical protein